MRAPAAAWLPEPGTPEASVQTPALIVDLDALERNLDRMADAARAAGVALRPHGKMHRSWAFAERQLARGAVGLCCQKVSEAEALVRAGLRDVFVSNEVRDPVKLARLAALAREATVAVCVDAADGVADLAAAVASAETRVDVLVEIDAGAGRCGVATPEAAVALARAVAAAPGLRFRGVQSYHGGAQHVADPDARRAVMDAATARTRAAVDALRDASLPPEVVTGGGTGSWRHEAASGLWTEVQCGSYAVLDADYARVREGDDRLDERWDHALFVLASVMSDAHPSRAVLDAGHKAVAVDSGPPVAPGFAVLDLSDEHCTLADPNKRLAVGDRLRLIPGHCDPTVNLHDHVVALRGGVVEAVWPVTARGCGW